MKLSLSTAHQQRGAVAIMVGVTIIALIGLLGIVIDLGHLYVRKTELQNAADAGALAGARQLNGTAAGIDAAVASAQAVAGANASDYAQTAVALPGGDSSHIEFGTSPDGPWVQASVAKAAPAPYSFIKVDTSGIAQGTRPTWFIAIVNSALASTTASGMAVAGATLCEGLPIFICQPAGGFKPGQAYFFGESPGYPIGPGNIGYFDPVPPGAPALISGANDMRDVICRGKTYCMGSPGTYGSLTQSAFGTLARAFNTRFDDYSSLPPSLGPDICRPDTNVKEYPYTSLSPLSKTTAWMSTAPDHQSEQDTGATLGVHWSVVRPEASGAAVTGVTASGKYPASGTPYTQPVGSIFNQQPVGSHRIYAESGRRYISMAIVDNCGAINGSGKPVHVIGFGRFFMPVKAVGTGGNKGIYVEYIETLPRPPASIPDIKLYR